MDMAAAPHCMSCNLERTLISIQPGLNRHDVRSYECSGCKELFRLVVERVSFESDDLIVLEADDLVFEEPSRKTAAR